MTATAVVSWVSIVISLVAALTALWQVKIARIQARYALRQAAGAETAAVAANAAADAALRQAAVAENQLALMKKDLHDTEVLRRREQLLNKFELGMTSIGKLKLGYTALHNYLTVYVTNPTVAELTRVTEEGKVHVWATVDAFTALVRHFTETEILAQIQRTAEAWDSIDVTSLGDLRPRHFLSSRSREEVCQPASEQLEVFISRVADLESRIEEWGAGIAPPT